MSRLFITGTGVVSPYGIGTASFMAGLLAQRSTIQKGRFGFPAAELNDFDPLPSLGAKGLRAIDRVTAMILVALQEALREARLEGAEGLGEAGVVVGTAFSGLDSIIGFFTERLREGAHFVTASRFGNVVLNAPASHASLRFGMSRLNSTVVSGLASGLDAIAYASDKVNAGYSPLILVGGADELSHGNVALFRQLGYLAEREARPCDPQGKGFNPGEGSAFLVLEEEGHARERRAEILAEVAGYGVSFDPAPLRNEPPTVAIAVRTIREALASAGLAPAEVSTAFVSANGMAAFDAMEAQALAEVFGPDLETLRLKQWLGETMGASGALAAVYAVKCLNAPEAPRAILVNAFSYSGHYVSLILRAPSKPGLLGGE